ncbi:MAG: aminotransferase class I/II-fold pyridoxal phosphate-dependent enzyme, partial [Anaerolineae bacterium]
MDYVMESPDGARTQINGRWRDYFAGCSYLGLQSHPGLLAAAAEALQRYGLGTATSRGGYGEHPLYREVEAAAAAYWEAERAVYYVTAYLGNAVLAQGLAGEYDRIFIDEASHYSVWDGARTTAVALHPFRHLDPADLAAQLRRHLKPGERPLIFSDGVFPISGEIAAVPAYLEALAPYEGAILCLDDAHATGVLGERGRGTMEHWGVDGRGRTRIYAAHTLSKALGSHGGVIAGDAALVERLARRAKALVATSPSPLPAAGAAAWALRLMCQDAELRSRLRSNVAAARAGLRRLGWPLPDSPVPILCLEARPGVDLARLRDELFARDICVAHVTGYT